MLKIDKETEELFLEKVKNLLLNGETVQSIKTVKTEKVRTDVQGEIVFTDSGTQTTRDTKLLPTPQWVYDLILKSISLDNAIELLTREGYLVVDPTEDVEVEQKSRGLSEYAVSEISKKLLGITED